MVVVTDHLTCLGNIIAYTMPLAYLLRLSQAIMRKKVASLIKRVRWSTNGIVFTETVFLGNNSGPTLKCFLVGKALQHIMHIERFAMCLFVANKHIYFFFFEDKTIN